MISLPDTVARTLIFVNSDLLQSVIITVRTAGKPPDQGPDDRLFSGCPLRITS